MWKTVYGSHKGDERADTDLMFQFCLPNGWNYQLKTDLDLLLKDFNPAPKSKKETGSSLATHVA